MLRVQLNRSQVFRNEKKRKNISFEQNDLQLIGWFGRIIAIFYCCSKRCNLMFWKRLERKGENSDRDDKELKLSS